MVYAYIVWDASCHACIVRLESCMRCQASIMHAPSDMTDRRALNLAAACMLLLRACNQTRRRHKMLNYITSMLVLPLLSKHVSFQVGAEQLFEQLTCKHCAISDAPLHLVKAGWLSVDKLSHCQFMLCRAAVLDSRLRPCTHALKMSTMGVC